jgi:hypothetical protein
MCFNSASILTYAHLPRSLELLGTHVLFGTEEYTLLACYDLMNDCGILFNRRQLYSVLDYLSHTAGYVLYTL